MVTCEEILCARGSGRYLEEEASGMMEGNGNYSKFIWIKWVCC